MCIRDKRFITGDTRNRGNKELSEQSNCSILQGTKVGSAKEHNQYVPIPQRVSQQDSILSSSKAILSNLKEVEYPPANLNIPQQHTVLTSIPGSLDLRLFPGVLSTFKGFTSPVQFKTSPGVQPSVPRKVESISPKQ